MQYAYTGKLFYLTTRIALHSDRFAGCQAGQRSPLFKSAVSRGPCVLIKCIEANVAF
jgi:hypothetical protein